MRFWDSSALVPLVCREPASTACRRWLRADPVMIVWSLAATEVISPLARKRRDGSLEPRRFSMAKRRLAKLERAWSEVAAVAADQTDAAAFGRGPPGRETIERAQSSTHQIF